MQRADDSGPIVGLEICQLDLLDHQAPVDLGPTAWPSRLGSLRGVFLFDLPRVDLYQRLFLVLSSSMILLLVEP